MDPYEILGISRNCTFNEVRARYVLLARKHHPDKLVTATEEKRKENEEYFKKVTVAYHKIEEAHKNGEEVPFCDFDDNQYINQDWRGIWTRFEKLFSDQDTWYSVKNIIKDVATKIKERDVIKKEHNIKVPVSLEDIENQKKKNLRLFLQGIDDPVFITVELTPESFPFTTKAIVRKYELHEIHVEFVVKEHDIYYYEKLLSVFDLFIEINITWEEIFKDKNITITDLQGNKKNFIIPPLESYVKPYVIKNEGLFKKGNLYVSFQFTHPSLDKWKELDEEKRKQFMSILNALYAH